MTFLEIIIVMWSEHVGRYHCSIGGAILLIVTSVHNVNHPFGVGVAVVRRMRRSIVYL